jgi:hypothetical protein
MDLSFHHDTGAASTGLGWSRINQWPGRDAR